MQEVLQLLTNPLVLKVILGYWIYSAFVTSMPSPAVVSQYTKSGAFLLIYGTLFGFLHALAGSLARAAIAFKLPGAATQEEQAKDASAGK